MGKPDKLKDIVSGIIKKLTKKEEKKQALKEAWEKAAGKEAAEHTKPNPVRKGRLVINVSDSARLYELTLRRKDILDALNSSIGKGKLKEIRFRVGDITDNIEKKN